MPDKQVDIRSASMREIDRSEIEALWDIYIRSLGIGQFVIDADHKIGDVEKARLEEIWHAFDCAVRRGLASELGK
jgi:hypothetical protein